ncbi:MAG: MFS transporter, partial [Desulfovibrio sp.]|nr:MFS transporter [Desulfovibrio sp.]
MEKKKIFLLALGHMSCDVNSAALPTALPYLRAAYGLDYQATGGLMLAYSCLSSIIQPVFG